MVELQVPPETENLVPDGETPVVSVIAVPVLLVTVTVFLSGVFTGTEPKATLVLESASAYMPVACNETVALFAPDMYVRVAVWLRWDVGANTTWKLHEVFAARLEPHVVVPREKSVPDGEIADVIARLDAALFVSFALSALLLPTYTVPKLREVGFVARRVAPVPLRGTCSGPRIPEEATVSVPVRMPSAMGLKLTRTVHVLPLDSVLAQEPPVMAKSPEILGEIEVMSAPVAFSVKILEELEVFNTCTPNDNDAGVGVRPVPVTASFSTGCGAPGMMSLTTLPPFTTGSPLAASSVPTGFGVSLAMIQ